jgi:hypothetical protein
LGSTTITATAGGTVSAVVNVTVKPNVTDVHFYPRDATNGAYDASIPTTALILGGEPSTYQLKPAFYPLDANDQTGTYENSDPSVVTVEENEDGALVTAVKHGAAFVTFTANDGDGRYYDTVLFCVLDPEKTKGDAARVGETDYPTLAAALNAAKAAVVHGEDGKISNEQTVTLLRDQEAGVVTLTDGVSLDLDGHMLYTEQIFIADNAVVDSVTNGTLVNKLAATATYSTGDLSLIGMGKNSTLALLKDVTLMSANTSAVGNNIASGTHYEKYTIDRIEDCRFYAIFTDPQQRSTLGNDAYAALVASYGSRFNYIGGEETYVSGIGCALIRGMSSSSSIVKIYDGTFDTPKNLTTAGVLEIYGGKFRQEPVSRQLGSSGDGWETPYVAIPYQDEDGDWFVITPGRIDGKLTINVDPAEAQVTLKEQGDDQEITPDSEASGNGAFVFPIGVGANYEYTVSASGYVTVSGAIRVPAEDFAFPVTLRQGEESTLDTNMGVVRGGDYITEGGTYYLDAPLANNAKFGAVTVATREPVRIVGKGIGDGDYKNAANAGVMYNDLVIDSCAGANLIIKNVWTNNSKGQGTASGATNLGYTALNFTGKGNTLTVEGVNLLENQEYVSSACIHVPKNAELTFKGDGTLYLYKYTAGSGIGGNSSEACGKLVFESGNYYIKGSKTGAVIGGDGMGEARNDDIVFNGANVVVINVATGSGVGDSNSSRCGGDVYMLAGSLTTYTEFEGAAIGKYGTLHFLGGSLKVAMTSNAVGPGYGLIQNPAPGLYVRDEPIKAEKKSGANDDPAARFVFDTNLLTDKSAPFNVTINGTKSVVTGLHNIGHGSSTNTVNNFTALGEGDTYYDTNLYFYLPKTQDQTLFVNGEEFSVSWNSAEGSFSVHKGGRYSISIDANLTGGAITAQPLLAAAGEFVSVALSASEGYRYVDNSLKYNDNIITTGGALGFAMPAENVTLTANFELISPDAPRYAIVAQGVFGGVIASEKAEAAEGETVAVTVTPNAGYSLVQGSLRANGTAIQSVGGVYGFVMPAGSVTLTAEFAIVSVSVPNGDEPMTTGATQDYVLVIAKDYALYDKAAGVSLNGAKLPSDAYEVKDGSTRVTVFSTYLNGLSAGTYTVSVSFTDGALIEESFAISDDPTYRIAIAPLSNGALSADKPEAHAGEPVTVTVMPAPSYRLVPGSLKYDGRAINAGANDVYSFDMPAWNVTLTADFIETETPATPPLADEDAFKEGIRGSGDINAWVWDGRSIDLRWFDPDKSSYTINTPAELAGLAALVNGLYNREIDTVAGKASYIQVNTGFGDDDGALGNNKSTATYHYGNFNFAGKTVRLGRDIDMGSYNYMPIGGQYLMRPGYSETRVDASFNGVFDGGGHSVTINVRRYAAGNYGDGQSVGLIGRLGIHDHDSKDLLASGLAVRNVAVYGSVSANRSVGGIVGKIGKTADNYAVIENCANFASITGTDAKGTGGIVGAGWNGGIIKNCYNAGTITNTGFPATAGISGSNEVEIENAYNIGKISSTGSTAAIASNNSGGLYTNVYWLEKSANVGVFGGVTDEKSRELTSEFMKSDEFVTLLGSAFLKDTNNINQGYPVLKWQGGTNVTTPPTSGIDDGSRPTVDVPSTTTVKDGEAITVVEIPEEGLALADSPNSRLVVNVDTEGESVDKIRAEMPAEFMKQASESHSEIEVRSDVANVLLPEKAVTELAAAGKDVSVKAEKNETENTYTFTVESGGKDLATVDGGIKAAIPVKDAETSAGTVAVLVHEDGTEEIIKKSAIADGELLVPLSGSATIRIEDRAKSFDDVSSGAWYADAVGFASSRELFQGTTESTFGPNASMTRAMLVTVLYRLENEPAAGTAAFTDVSATGYYAEAVAWASANGIVEGVGDGLFAPNAEITREQLATMLYRYANAQGLNFSAGGDLSSFPDANTVSAWASEALSWAVGSGIITGRSNIVGTELAPKGTATRAEVAAMIMRMIKKAAKF